MINLAQLIDFLDHASPFDWVNFQDRPVYKYGLELFLVLQAPLRSDKQALWMCGIEGKRLKSDTNDETKEHFLLQQTKWILKQKLWNKFLTVKLIIKIKVVQIKYLKIAVMFSQEWATE